MMDRRYAGPNISEQRPRPASEEDLRAIRHLDELHMMGPALGSRRLSDELKALGLQVGRRKCAC